MTECKIIQFRPKPRPVEMTHQEMELHYARRINGLIQAMEDAGFGPTLDRIAIAWRASAEVAGEGRRKPKPAGGLA
jgi:hypothetical protein